MEPNVSAAPVAAAESGVNALLRSVTRNLQSYMLVVALLVIWVGFGAAAPGYTSAEHIQNIFSQMAIIGIMACGMVFVIVTGGIDLSVGYGSGFVSVVAAGLLYYGVADKWISAILPHVSPGAHQAVTAGLVVVLGLLMGVLLGAFQGFIISRLSVPPFIVTLGGFSIFKSGILIVTQGRSLFITSYETYKYIAQGLVPPIGGYLIAIIVAVALFVKVFTGRARKAKHGVALGSLPLELLRAAIFTVLVFGYVLIVNRAFDKAPEPQAAAATDTAPAAAGDVEHPTDSAPPAAAAAAPAAADATKPEAKKEAAAAPAEERPTVGTSTPDLPKIEEATEEEAVQEEYVPPKGVPVLVVILGVVALLMHYVSRNTRFGRYTYAYGGNREAARLSGINTKDLIFKVYVLMGLLMAVSGVALAGYVGSGTTAAGQGYELDVIASCILGGTSTLGGEGTIFGAVVGALIMQSLGNGLQMMNVNSNWHYAIKGLVLILAVYADIQFKKKRG